MYDIIYVYYSVHGILYNIVLFMSAMEYRFDTNVLVYESLPSEMRVLVMNVVSLNFESSSSFVLLVGIKIFRRLLFDFVDSLRDNSASGNWTKVVFVSIIALPSL